MQRCIKKRLESARWFIDAVRQRQSTMLRISEEIFRHQRDFLEKGAQALRPLRMQEVADEVGVHISTVSRAVSGKFAQTPRGIFPLKFFFTSGTAKSSGEAASQVSIKYKIRELVEGEDPSQPYSDDVLANLLHAERQNVEEKVEQLRSYNRVRLSTRHPPTRWGTFTNLGEESTLSGISEDDVSTTSLAQQLAVQKRGPNATLLGAPNATPLGVQGGPSGDFLAS